MKKALPFHPRAGQVLVGDFTGFAPPEINKLRPVIVVSPRLPYRAGLVAIVPISTTAPVRDLPYTFKLSRNYAPWGERVTETWAKCDLLMNIGLHRLNGFKVGRRKYETPSISPEDLAGVRQAVLNGLGFTGR